MSNHGRRLTRTRLTEIRSANARTGRRTRSIAVKLARRQPNFGHCAVAVYTFQRNYHGSAEFRQSRLRGGRPSVSPCNEATKSKCCMYVHLCSFSFIPYCSYLQFIAPHPLSIANTEWSQTTIIVVLSQARASSSHADLIHGAMSPPFTLAASSSNLVAANTELQCLVLTANCTLWRGSLSIPLPQHSRPSAARGAALLAAVRLT